MARFEPVYVYPSGYRTHGSRGVKGRKSGKATRLRGYYYDTKTKKIISYSSYYKLKFGTTRYSVSTRPKGMPTPSQILKMKEKDIPLYEASRYSERTGKSLADVMSDTEFLSLEEKLAYYYNKRRDLIREGKERTKEYRDLVSPDGPYAQVLVELGLRQPEERHKVGDTGKKKKR